MHLTDLNIDEAELGRVVNSTLAQVTPDYAAARFESCSTIELCTPSGSPIAVVLLNIQTSSASATRGQYAPLTDNYNRGFVDEYLFGAINGHWQAIHNRDLSHEVRFVVDIHETDDALPLYRFVDVDDARIRGLIPDSSPIDVAVKRYSVRRLLQVGDHLGGPSPGLVEMVASEAERLERHCFLDVFAGSCILSRVALEHGVRQAVCIDVMLDKDVAAENLGRYAPLAELRRATLRSALGTESYDLVAIDPFYDHTLIAINEFSREIAGRFRTAVINLGLALPTTWQARLHKVVETHMCIKQVRELHGERIAVCGAKN
jgi:hypothetical protein